jgi:hypothetical protein
VVSDGSTDATAEIARSAPGVRLIDSKVNRGLSHARNEALAAATGEIIAYLDDDARPDPDWLRFLALAFARSDHAAIGGPNIPPPGDGWIADCVAHAPGGPVHVLVADDLAEHIPGCNTAVRREKLVEIGGFDARFRIAGDDVDMCWRLQEAGGTIGFSPGAMVWHYARNSVKAYLRQQRNYGRAEALLEDKWPDRYNRLGHLHWSGIIYGDRARSSAPGRRARISYGTWGTEPFQSIYARSNGLLSSLTHMPESHALVVALLVLSALSVLWTPLALAIPLLLLCLLAVTGRAFAASGRRHDHDYRKLPVTRRMRMRALTTGLHLAQPVVRLAGRGRAGLHPWRRRTKQRVAVPRPRVDVLWSERWHATETWIGTLERKLRAGRALVRRGGTWDRWDLRVRGGAFGVARLLCVVEEHGGGRQQVRVRSWPVVSRVALALAAGCWVLAALAFGDGAPAAGAVLAGFGAIALGRAAYDCAVATGAVLDAIRALGANIAALDPPEPVVPREELAKRIADALGAEGDRVLEAPEAAPGRRFVKRAEQRDPA